MIREHNPENRDYNAHGIVFATRKPNLFQHEHLLHADGLAVNLQAIEINTGRDLPSCFIHALPFDLVVTTRIIVVHQLFDFLTLDVVDIHLNLAGFRYREANRRGRVERIGVVHR